MPEVPTAAPGPASEGRPVRPLTRNLVHAIALDMWPSPATCMDFGLKSQEHYEAVYYPVRNGEVTAEQLDAALGSGPKLTALVNAASSNPHQGIRFETPWDHLLPEPDEFPEVEEPSQPSRGGMER